MSHSFENFMGNKGFHPASWTNQKKLWEAEQRQKQEELKQEALKQQYLKEQERYKTKELMGRSNPLNFMYEAPPGLAKERGKSEKTERDGEPRLTLVRGRENELEENDKEQDGGALRHEWEPKDGRAAPRQDYAKGLQLKDQPFGIEVRNVKCFKCGRLGHVNTDKICPLYGLAKPAATEDKKMSSSSSSTKAGPLPLPDLDTVEDGLIFKQCVREAIVDTAAANQQILASEDEEMVGDQYEELLTGFSKKERKRILKKLQKMDRNEGDSDDGKKAKKKKRKRDRYEEKDELKWKEKKRKKVENEWSDEQPRKKAKRGSQKEKKHRSREGRKSQSRNFGRSRNDSSSDDSGDSYEGTHRSREHGRRHKDKSESSSSHDRQKKRKHHHEESSESSPVGRGQRKAVRKEHGDKRCKEIRGNGGRSKRKYSSSSGESEDLWVEKEDSKKQIPSSSSHSGSRYYHRR